MKYLKIGLFFLFLLGFATFFLTLPRLIPVKKITCSNQYGPCDEVLQADLEKVLGKNLLLGKKEIKAILENNLLVKDYSLLYRIPNTLQVYLLVKKPKFALWSETEKRAALVEENGLILAWGNNTNLPKLIVAENLLAVGEKVSPDKLFGLALMSDLSYFYQVNNGKLTEQRLEILLNGRTVLFPLEGDRQVLLGALKVILSQLNAEPQDPKMEKISIIDLRFKNPILK
jgi:cell division septal protein FtsQ